MSSNLKLKAPDALPAKGVTATAFKVYVNRLKAYLLQDTTNYLFITTDDNEPGLYALWSPLEKGKRIRQLHNDDSELDAIDSDRTTNNMVKNRKKATLCFREIHSSRKWCK